MYCSGFIAMPRKAPEQATETNSSEDTTTPVVKKRRVNTGKPRCPARPYRRVETPIMKSRIEEYTNKMQVLQSKVTLLRQRLDMHKLEMEMRENEEAEDKQNEN